MSPVEEQEFRHFVATRSRALLHTAFLLTGDPHDAQDLLQTALMAVARRWAGIRRREQPEPYVRQAMYRHQVNAVPAARSPSPPTRPIVQRTVIWRPKAFCGKASWRRWRPCRPASAAITLDAPRAGVVPEAIADSRRAVEWFAAERPVLLAAFQQAVHNGIEANAWRMAWALSGYLDMAGYWEERVATLRAALDIDPPDWPWQAFAHRTLGHSYVRMGKLDYAHAHLGQALVLFRESGDRIGEARTHLNIGIVLDRQARHEEGLVRAQTALELYLAADHIAGQAGALNALGWHHAQLGDFQAALTFCQQALDLHQNLNHRHAQADLLDTLGYIHLNLGHYDIAISHYEAAIDALRSLGNRFDEAGMLVNLGDAHLAAGDREAARKVWRQALAIFDELDHTNEALLTRLDGLSRA